MIMLQIIKKNFNVRYSVKKKEDELRKKRYKKKFSTIDVSMKNKLLEYKLKIFNLRKFLFIMV